MTQARKEVYGTLSTITVRLPYETPEDQAKADETNRQLAGLAIVFRGATDWGYTAYGDMASNILRAKPLQKHIPYNEPTPFKSGDLVKIFKTVSDGDVHWQGDIKLGRHNQYNRGMQRGVAASEWAGMFFDAMPAKLERDGKIIFGALEPFCETGTEGIVWSVMEYGKNSYAALNCLRDGDKLTVYSNVRDGDVEWEGPVEFGPEAVSKIDWTEIMRDSLHMSTKDWLSLSYQRRPVVVTPK